MLRLLAIIFLWFWTAMSAGAQQGGLVSLGSGQDGRGWEAVGRIDIANKGFCTGALIREDLVLTAAHCVYDDDGGLIEVDRFEFLAGFRSGRAEAYRNVRRVVAHPGFDPSGHNGLAGEVAEDVALLQLDRPIRTTRINPFSIAARPYRGDEVGIVSYARQRSEAPSLESVCEVLGHQSGIMVMTCDVDYGASGSPVFRVRDGIAQVVSVVSSMAMLDDQKVALGTSLQDPLAQLLDMLEGSGMTRTPLNDGNSTGAKFVRP